MKTKFLTLAFSLMTLVSANVFAGTGTGKITDITFRTQDNLLVIRTENKTSQPSCVNWYHNFVLSRDSLGERKALYAMALAAQISGKTVKITGTGSCLTGTASEEILEINIGS